MTPPNTTSESIPTADKNHTQSAANVTISIPGTRSNGTEARDKYFKENYDYLTGVRIASTLGGFFALVLLTLLYKSKCKKNSCASTPVQPANMSPILGLPPQCLNHNFINNAVGTDNYKLSMSQTLIDSACMNRVNDKPYMSPAVLLTAANSESSEEDEEYFPLGSSRAEMHVLGVEGGGYHNNHPQQPPQSRNIGFSSFHLNPVCSTSNHLISSTLSPPVTNSGVVGGGGGGVVGGVGGGIGKLKRLQQNIDINVILPTPTISPSGSENFCTRVHKQRSSIPIPVPNAVARRVVEKERARTRTNSFGADTYSTNSYSCSTNGNGGGANPLFFLDNLKYVDDTSSENIPTRASDFEDQDQDTRSIGSDSVFAYFEHNFDHVAPLCSSEGVSVSGLTVASVSTSVAKRRVSLLSGSGTEDDDCEFRVILTQAEAQVHHRESFCSELESLNDYLESRRRSSSTQTTVSDLRHCLSISSATSPPNFPPQSSQSLQQSPLQLLPSHAHVGDQNCSPVVSPPNSSSQPVHLSIISNPHLSANVLTVSCKNKDRNTTNTESPSTSTNPSMSSASNTTTLLAVVTAHPSTPFGANIKKSTVLKKMYSLQCDESSNTFNAITNATHLNNTDTLSVALHTNTSNPSSNPCCSSSSTGNNSSSNNSGPSCHSSNPVPILNTINASEPTTEHLSGNISG